MSVKKVTINGNLTLTSSTLTVSGVDRNPNVVVSGNITLGSASTITSAATTTSQEYRLNITANDINVQAGSFINVNGKGYTQGAVTTNRMFGNVNVSMSGTQAAAECGGSYGGQATCGSGYTLLSAIYGDMFLPNELGSSGARTASTASGVGGGSIKITTAGTLTVDGTISANGTLVNGYGGSGGSVWINTNTITGSSAAGMITADGGDITTTSASPGSGGRIAVYYTTASGDFSTPANRITRTTAYGGAESTSTRAGAAGTVIYKSAAQEHGDLIVNNNLRVSGALTQIVSPSSNTSTYINSNVLGTTSAFTNSFSASNFYNGLWLNPKVSQNATTDLIDDSMYGISSNTTALLNLSRKVVPVSSWTPTTSPDMNADGFNGVQTFRTVLILDNLEVKNRARLSVGANNNLLVRQGDVGSNNATTFVQDGYIQANVVDLNGVSTWTDTANSVSAITNKRSLDGTHDNCP